MSGALTAVNVPCYYLWSTCHRVEHFFHHLLQEIFFQRHFFHAVDIQFFGQFISIQIFARFFGLVHWLNLRNVRKFKHYQKIENRYKKKCFCKNLLELMCLYVCIREQNAFEFPAKIFLPLFQKTTHLCENLSLI